MPRSIIIKDTVGERIYYKRKDLWQKAKVKPLRYTIDVLISTKKDGEKNYLKQKDFDRISIKYKDRFNWIIKLKWLYQHIYNNFRIWWQTKKFKTSEEIYQYRWEICKKCPELRTDIPVCKVCSCNMALKTKLRFAQCPLNKWI